MAKVIGIDLGTTNVIPNLIGDPYNIDSRFRGNDRGEMSI